MSNVREVVTASRQIVIPAGERIIRETAAKYGIRLADMLGYNRVPADLYVRARIDAARRIRAELGYSVSLIGRIMRRDHSTISYWLGNTARQLSVYDQDRGKQTSLGRVFATIGRKWIANQEIAQSLGMTMKQVELHTIKLSHRKLIIRGGTYGRALWRRA